MPDGKVIEMADGGRRPITHRAILIAPAFLLLCLGGGAAISEDMVDAVRRFGDTVIEHGRDTYGEQHTPLFVDVLNVETLKSPKWFPGSGGDAKGGRRIVMSNFSYQQNLLRVLVGLSRLTGDDKYRKEAERATRHMFDHHRHKESGLFYWGTHCSLELEGDSLVYADLHELKAVYPFYDFLYEVDPEKTEKFIKAFWAAHIEQWDTLTFDRHGEYRKYDVTKVWVHEWKDPDYFPVWSTGVGILNAGTDLMYAGAFLRAEKNDTEASLWAGRLFSRFVKGRDKTTNILPTVGNYRRDEGITEAQFRFPNALAWTLYIDYVPFAVVGRDAFGVLRTVERLAKAGEKEESQKMLKPLCEHLVGYAKCAYIPEKNAFKPILTDGTDLTGYELPVGGYWGAKGEVMETIPAEVRFLPVYALAYRLQKDESLWGILRSLCKGNGLGDIGGKPGNKPQLDISCREADPCVVFAFVELYRATQQNEYLRFARHICKNIMQQRYHPENGLFTLDRDHQGCHLDCYEPLALLTVAAAEQGRLDLIPTWESGGMYDWHHNRIVSGYSAFIHHKTFGPPLSKYVLRRPKLKSPKAGQ